MKCHVCGLVFKYLPVVRVSGRYRDYKTSLDPTCLKFYCKSTQFDVYYCKLKIGSFTQKHWNFTVFNTFNTFTGSTDHLFSLVSRERRYLDKVLYCLIIDQDEHSYQVYDIYKYKTTRLRNQGLTSVNKIPNETYYDEPVYILTIDSYHYFGYHWQDFIGDPRNNPDEPINQDLFVKKVTADAILIKNQDNNKLAWFPKYKIYNHDKLQSAELNQLFPASIDNWFWNNKLSWTEIAIQESNSLFNVEIESKPTFSLRDLMIRQLIKMSKPPDASPANAKPNQTFSLVFIKKMLGVSELTTEVDFCLCCRTKLDQEQKKDLICQHCMNFVIPELVIEKLEEDVVLPLYLLPIDPYFDPISIEFGELGVSFDKKFFYYNDSYKSFLEPKFLCLECGLEFVKKQFLIDHKSNHHRESEILKSSSGKEYIPTNNRFTMTSRNAECIVCQLTIQKFTVRLTKRDTMLINGFNRNIDRHYHIKCANFPLQSLVELWNLQLSLEVKPFQKIKEKNKLEAFKTFKAIVDEKSEELGSSLRQLE